MYEVTIGLEVHLKIKSPTKLFCQCENRQDFDSIKPNTNICPVCTAQPGSLPVLSKEPFVQALLLGKALGCEIPKHSQFDRKSYFYPDLPPGYQITQLYHPTNINGKLKYFLNNFKEERVAEIRDAHIETDTGKRIKHQNKALLDFNRAGTPLVEVVTGPDFHSEDEVVEFLKELQRIAKYNDISDADMEKGQMRVDVNISLKKPEDKELGTRVELKNMNSFSAIRKAIEHEFHRQRLMLDAGESFDQETRRWDDAKRESFTMRSKEEALDYRYFPEPDMPPIEVSDELRAEIDEVNIIVPHDIIRQMTEEYHFNKEYINALIGDKTTLKYFQDMVAIGYEPKLVAKWLSGPIAAYCKEHYVTIDRLPFDEDEFKSFLDEAKKGEIIESQLKIVMNEMLGTDKSIGQIIKEKGFDAPAVADDELTAIIAKILADNPGVVKQYKGGKESTMGFFLGQAMRATQGKANPKTLQPMIKKALDKL